MGSKGRLLFDLNEPPAENEDDNDSVVCFQPQRAIPSITAPTDLFVASAGPQGIVNNNAFSHASSVSGFQPFVRSKVVQGPDVSDEKKSFMYVLSNVASSSKSSNGQDIKASPIIQSGLLDVQDADKEEGEWSDAEGSGDAYKRSVLRDDSSSASDKQVLEKSTVEMTESNVHVSGVDNISPNHGNVKNENGGPSEKNPETNDKKGDTSMDGSEESASVPKQREVRGIEANHALKYGNSIGKRPKLDQQKEAMLGKKRSRQTMFLNLEDVKQAGVLKSSTPRRQIPAPTIIRTMKETRASAERGDKQSQPVVRDAKQSDLLSNEGNTVVESNECKSESNGDYSSGSVGAPRRLNTATDVSSEGQTPMAPRQGSWKLPPDTRQHKNSQFTGRKAAISSQTSVDSKLVAKKLPTKKQTTSNQYQDTSVERLLREVTNENFWHHPGTQVKTHYYTTSCLLLTSFFG